MNVNHPEYLSKLFIENITFTGHVISGFEINRIYDHVEDFPHVRPVALASTPGANPLIPALDEVSTYFDQRLQQAIFFDVSTKAVDPRYTYQSVGSIYQIPR